MRYYVVSDVHGYFTELKQALEEQGFFEDKQPYKLIICGDIYDRGKEAKELQEFILDLMKQDEIILIRGNHEDLTLELLNGWYRQSYWQFHHSSNGTIDTICQLLDTSFHGICHYPEEAGRKFLRNPYIQTIIPAMRDYYETENYIFTHGWIPCMVNGEEYTKVENWRTASKGVWESARWINGMEAAHHGILEDGKTIVCGHWHCSFGHANYEGDGGEFDHHPNFNPYYGKGIIALDACTPISKKINCIVIED